MSDGDTPNSCFSRNTPECFALLKETQRRATIIVHEQRGQASMKSEESRAKSIADESEIRNLIEKWSKGVRDQDRGAIRRDHDDDILMFDVPPPFQSRGIDEYMATWETFFSSAERPVSFNFTDVQVTAGRDVAFATAVGHCVTIGKDGQREPLDFRLTIGLRKIGERWRVTHEHHSLPAV